MQSVFHGGTRYVISSRKELFDAAGNQHGNIHQHARQGDAAAGDEVLGLPMRRELGLLSPQALEVIEVLSVPEHEIPDAVPGGCGGMSIDTRARFHAGRVASLA